MNRVLLTLLVCCLSVSFTFAHKLSGKLTDNQGNPIPYVRVMVLETNYGATTNESGLFSLKLPTGNYSVQFQHLGYQTKVLKLDMNEDKNLIIRLESKDVELDAVEIESGKKDPAYAIMKEVIANKRTHLKQFDAFKCETYMKLTLERDTLHKVQENDQVSITISFGKKKKKQRDSLLTDSLLVDSLATDSILNTVESNLLDTLATDSLYVDSLASDSLLNDSTVLDSVPIGKKKIVLVESVASTYFDAPNRYKTIVRAYRNIGARGEEGSGRAGMGYGFGNEDMPVYRTQTTNPYIFYQDVSDADFNFYQNLISAPKLGDRPYISPLNSTQWQLTYKYHLDSAYMDQGKVHYRISFWPRNPVGPYFKGSMLIVDKVFAIKSLTFEVMPSSTPYFQKFVMTHSYQETIDKRWTLAEEQYVYEIKDGPNTYFGDNYAKHTEYELDSTFPKNFFKNELRRTDKDAFEKSSDFWAAMRPVALEESEVKFEVEQDSIRAYYMSEEYLKEQDSIFNKLGVLDFLVNGIQFRNRKRRLRFYLPSLLEQPNPFGVGGYRHNFGGTVVKTWKNFQRLAVTAYADYGVANQDLKGRARLSYTYNPRRFARATFRFGDQYVMVNNNETITAILSRTNFLNKVNIGFGHSMEVVNGLTVTANVDFGDRKPIDSLQLSQFFQEGIEALGETNRPRSFDIYREFLVDIRLRWIPGQKYIMEPYRKVNLPSKWPTFTLRYKKAIPGIFGSDLTYDFLSLRVNHQIQIGTMGTSNWTLFTGKFLTAGNLPETEDIFFRGSDPFLFVQPLRNFQALGPTLSTINAFLSGHYIHSFNGALLNKVPLLKKIKAQAAGGGSVLLIQDGNFFHSEVFAGLGVPFRIRMQRMKISAFLVTSYSNLDNAIGSQIKFGLTFYDQFRRRWEY